MKSDMVPNHFCCSNEFLPYTSLKVSIEKDILPQQFAGNNAGQPEFHR